MMKSIFVASLLLASFGAGAQPFKLTDAVCTKVFGIQTCPSKLVCTPKNYTNVWANGKIDKVFPWYEYYIFDLINGRYGAGEEPESVKKGESSINSGPLKLTGTVSSADYQEKSGSLQYVAYTSYDGELRFVGALGREIAVVPNSLFDKVNTGRIAATVVSTAYTDSVTVVHTRCIPIH